jgi:hypothetical protein
VGVRPTQPWERIMAIFDLVLTAALITGSGPSAWSEPSTLKAAFPRLRPALTCIALQAEILDPRETRYVLASADDLPSDLQMLTRRFQELKDAPRVVDAFRFPDRTVCNELLSFNRAYRNHVEVRQPLELGNAYTLRTIQREVDYLYQVWDTVRDARCEYYYVTVRRQALKRLKDMLGEDDYYAAKLPPHVPIWRFEEIR